LFTKVSAKTLAHTAEKLHCDDAIVFVIVIMSHFDDVLEYEVSSIFVVKLVSYCTEFTASFFLGLNELMFTSY
jgi:hypothetical protein